MGHRAPGERVLRHGEIRMPQGPPGRRAAGSGLRSLPLRKLEGICVFSKAAETGC